ncbi:MAG: energy-coupling factor transporter ATPase [Ruminococcus sp.]|nr:energy-coupling factor transporter ATPase [Ruminococcus sp.]MDD7669857.1 energy-coupling factor transporter ATPase [Ruminococcus sp.]MDY2743211.1 energy-coupling factor transporter ATPase [Eubacteriales bacterium]
MNEPIIKLENVTVRYGEGTPFALTALDGINLDIPAGCVCGIIGHTGSGKSTLAQLLNGLLQPTLGKVLFKGEDINRSKQSVNDIRFKVGLVFQYPEYQLFEETVEKDIAFGPHNMSLSEEEISKRVADAARFCGIDREMLAASPFEISGGQKRRAAIAGVIAMSPEVLVLDEPAAGLDPKGRDEILGGLVEYRKTTGTTMILISHSMEDIANWCDRIVVMKNGGVFMQGTVEEIFESAERLFDAGLDVPQITKLFIELKKRGVVSRSDVYTLGYAKKLIESGLGK